MDPISIAGAVISGGSLLSKIFGGDSAEQERRARMQRLLNSIAEQRAITLAQGSREIVKGTESAASVSRQAAARRAAAAGVSGTNAESYVLPGESAAYNRGTDALENFTTDTNRTFDNARINAEMDFANRPISPDASDYLMEIGSGALKFGQDQEYVNAMRDIATPTPAAAPVVSQPTAVEPRVAAEPLTEKTFEYVPQSGFDVRRTASPATVPDNPLDTLAWVRKYRASLLGRK